MKAIFLCVLMTISMTAFAASPADAIKLENDVEEAIKTSDNFKTNRDVFVKVSVRLIHSGMCRLSDYQEWGGWIKSSNHKASNIYFTYCGGSKLSNKLYLDINTGDVSR